MIEEISVDFFGEESDDFSCDIMIEGLPGVGQVGKLAAEHVMEELGAEKIAEIRSIFFPPQVLVDETGVAHLPKNEIYRYSNGEMSIMFLIGDFQSGSAEGHYILTDTYLDIAEKLGVKRIYTLGGYGVGHLIQDIRVLAAVNNENLKDEVTGAGAVFAHDEPGGGIIGASGLLLGLGANRGIEGICLMGETSGYIVDPKSSSCLLEVLSRLLGISVDSTKLQERANEMEVFLERLKTLDQAKTDDELSYIG